MRTRSCVRSSVSISIALAVVCTAERARADNGVDPPSPLRWQWVVDRALGQSPSLAVARARIRAARARSGQVALEDPMVMVRAWNVPLDVVSAPPGQIMIMAQQSFPLSGELGDRERVEATRVLDAEIERDLARHVLVEDAELAYLALWEARARHAALRELVAMAERVREVALARIGAGGSPSDVTSAELELARVRALAEAARIPLDTARAQLRALLALPGRTRIPDTPDLAPRPSLPSLATLVAEARRQRPEARLSGATLARARALEELSGSAGGATLTVGAGAMIMHEEEEPASWMLELGLSLPLWRSARNARSDEATALASEADESRRAYRVAIERDVIAAYEALTMARVRLDALRARIAPAARLALDTALAQYAASGNIALVLDALRAKVATDLEIVEATAAVLRAEVRLSHATGRSTHGFAEAQVSR